MAMEVEMTTVLGAIQTPLLQTGEIGANEPFTTPRCESREQVVRHVEYCRFPRRLGGLRLHVGFTCDVSHSGLRVRTSGNEPVGTLLRIVVRCVEGELEREVIARVVWTRPTGDGRCWMGLAVVAECERGQIWVAARKARPCR